VRRHLRIARVQAQKQHRAVGGEEEDERQRGEKGVHAKKVRRVKLEERNNTEQQGEAPPDFLVVGQFGLQI
jgi:hypothetical protein